MTLNYAAVHNTVVKNLRYIADPEKQVAMKDVFNVCRYISGDHSAPAFARGYNCSTNAILSAQQFEMDRQKYWSRKKGGLSGMALNKQEILAHHFFASAHKDDYITPELLQKIMDEFIKRCHLENFRIYTSIHNNTDELHIHFSINAYKMDGSGKFIFNLDNFNAMKIQLNYICAEHGLSIIDDADLRYWAWESNHDRDYIRWLDRTKAEGKILVRENSSGLQRHERWERIKAERKLKTNPPKTIKQEIDDVIADTYDDNIKHKNDYKSFGMYPAVRNKKKYYRCKLWSDDGRKRGTLEMLFLLAAAVITDTNDYAVETNQNQPRVNTAKEIQRMINGITAAQAYCIESVEDLNAKKKEIGADINAIQNAIYYVKKEMKTNNSEELEEKLKKLQSDLWIEQHNYAAVCNVGRIMQRSVRDQYKYDLYEFENKSFDEIVASFTKIHDEQTLGEPAVQPDQYH